jgi:uncharacterized protein (DUF488 family)
MGRVMKVYTIGFAKKSAEKFFELLIKNNVKKVVDIRLNNTSQLAGFSKGSDLEYFLKKIGNIEYEHNTSLAPTKELFDDYKANLITWGEFEVLFRRVLEERNAIKQLDLEKLDHACFLCSEDLPVRCHRRLVAEEISNITDCEIIHL